MSSLSFSLLHFLSLLYPCPAWSGPPYICKEKKWPSSFNSLFLSLTFSLFCHHTPCDCKTLPHSVSIDSDRPQKRPFALYFSFFFLSSWWSWTTCHSCRLSPTGSCCFWVIKFLLEICVTQVKNKTLFVFLVFYLKGLFFFHYCFGMFWLCLDFGFVWFWVWSGRVSALVLIDEMIGECELKWLEVNWKFMALS